MSKRLFKQSEASTAAIWIKDFFLFQFAIRIAEIQRLVATPLLLIRRHQLVLRGIPALRMPGRALYLFRMPRGIQLSSK